MNNKSITDFLSEEYKEFAFYSIENRAIPSVIDGFKPSQRKIIHISSQIWKNGSEKALKVFQLTGKVASDCLHYDTEILLSNGESVKIGDWFHKFPDVEMEVVCIDDIGSTTVSKGFSPKISLQKYVYEIETEDGNVHKLSGNHEIMLSNGVYKKVSEITVSDNLKSIS